MKRKMVSILLALTMLTTMALTACGQKNDNSSEAPAESVSGEWHRQNPGGNGISGK